MDDAAGAAAGQLAELPVGESDLEVAVPGVAFAEVEREQ
jgi:hypothetical protein